MTNQAHIYIDAMRGHPPLIAHHNASRCFVCPSLAFFRPSDLISKICFVQCVLPFCSVLTLSLFRLVLHIYIYELFIIAHNVFLVLNTFSDIYIPSRYKPLYNLHVAHLIYILKIFKLQLLPLTKPSVIVISYDYFDEGDTDM